MKSHLRLPRGLAALAGGLLAASCGNPATNTITVQTMDRPTDVAFGCYGRLRVVGANASADADDPVDFSPQPLESCRIRTGPSINQMPSDDPDRAPPGQEDLAGQVPLGPGLSWYGFVLQPVAGTVAVVRAEVQGDGKGYQTGEMTVVDGDRLSPGQNSLSVGSQPIAIATVPSGCHVLTANAGSCDLSVIDVDRVIERPEGQPIVKRLAITTADGSPLLARPGAMLAELGERAIGEVCPAEPEGLLYVAYPDCHAVAVIDSATGAAVASIRFAADGTATLGDGNLQCAAQCGTPQPVADGARPVTLDLVRDPTAGFQRLAIGLENRPVVTVVDLGLDWRPAGVEQIELEGDVGVMDIAITKRIGMTGAIGFNDDTSTYPAQFVYAAATDGTVRVAEVSTQDTECDTQIDPRFLRAVSDPGQLICFPVGNVANPPRRPLARGPGIQLPDDDFALTVTVTQAGEARMTSLAGPGTPIGHLALIGGSLGTVYTANIDDDAYNDTFIEIAPLASDLALALPHQLRDGVRLRNMTSADPQNPEGTADCGFDGPQDTSFLGFPRVSATPTRSNGSAVLAQARAYMQPNLRQFLCERGMEKRILSELAWNAPAALRSQAFPDLQSVPYDESWQLTWEGSLSNDSATTSIDGPAVRAARLTVGGGAMVVADPSRPFCAAGVERFDHVVLRGCDPTRGAGQCGLGETCYVHPDATVATGACLPAEQADALGALCRDYLVSVRKYAVQEASAGQLILSERRRVLRTTPVGGCTSVAQCNELALYERKTLVSAEHPISVKDPEGQDPRTWACEPDPTRDGSINRCVSTCQSNDQCEAGTVCSAGYCIEGPLPSPQCIPGLQRYELHGTGAYVAIGTRSGYLHPIVAEAGTGRCIKDPAASPLLIGRIPLDAPPCTGSGPEQVTPNPCKTTVEHTYPVPDYTDLDTCTAPTEGGLVKTVPRTSMVDAIRFQNPMFTTNLVEPTYPGDARCLYDRGGTLTGIPVVYPGANIRFRVVGGFLGQAAGTAVVFPASIVRSPDGAVWIVDEGDITPGGNVQINTRGQVERVDPDALGAGAFVR